MAKRFELDRKEVSKQILKGTEVRGLIDKEAESMARAAGHRFFVYSETHALRYSSTVIDPAPDALNVEASQGNLSRALASRGVARRFGKR
jgi:hypothetical protein